MTFSNIQVDIDTLPDVSSIEVVPIAASYAKVNTLICATVAAVLVLLLGTLGFVVDPNGRPILHSAAACAAVMGLIAVPYTYRYCRNIGYALRQHDFVIHRGVFFFSQTVQPLARIQHVELQRGPIEKRLGLATLKVFSAGQGKETFNLPGLEVATAERLRATVLDYRSE